MFSVTNLLCDQRSGNERLRYGHSREGVIPKPVVVWALTKACNLRCVHCYASADANPAPGELTNAEGRALLDDLARFGVPAVLFSGGEPLHRPDAIELLTYARSLNLSCTLSTNGLLIDDVVADRLAVAGLKYVGISIDGTQARHDKLRGQKGAFDGSLAAIKRCRDRGMKVGVRFTVHALNVDDLDHVFDLCLEHRVDRLCVYHLAYAGRGDKMKRVDLTGEQTRSVVDRIFARSLRAHADGHGLEVLTVGNHTDAAYLLLQLQQSNPARYHHALTLLQGTGGNRSGSNIASIDSTGNVHYDQFSWHYACGNIRQTPFSELWSHPKDLRLTVLRARRPHLPARCQSCRFLDVCNGNLRTRAESASGHWLGPDPGCYLTDQEIFATQASDDAPCS